MTPDGCTQMKTERRAVTGADVYLELSKSGQEETTLVSYGAGCAPWQPVCEGLLKESLQTPLFTQERAVVLTYTRLCVSKTGAISSRAAAERGEKKA